MIRKSCPGALDIFPKFFSINDVAEKLLVLTSDLVSHQRMVQSVDFILPVTESWVMPGFGPLIMPCPPEARAAALEVLYCRVPEGLRDQLIVEVQDEATRGDIDLSGLWIARERSGQIVGVVLTQPLAGKAAAVWAPEVKPSWCRPAVAGGLIRAALADLRERGFRLAQAVLDESAGCRAAGDLTRGGMPRVTELLYLERETALPLPFARTGPLEGDVAEWPSADCFDWKPFEPGLEAEFRSVLQATYIGSLDMPELEGARSLDDIMETHRATGRFDSERWQLGYVAGKPEAASILLLAEVPSRDVWEVIYLGLTPAARGCGLGRAVIDRALKLARSHVPRLELAVDCRNTPAARLYRSAGFALRDRRTVHLAVLSRPLF
jgi:mycothiol synthase